MNFDMYMFVRTSQDILWSRQMHKIDLIKIRHT